MTAEEFVRQVMSALGAESPASLADKLGWPRGKERTIARWLAGQTKPSYINVIDMVERAGLLSRGEGRPSVPATPADPLAALAVAVGKLAVTQAAIADELGVPRADVELPQAPPSQQRGTPKGRRRKTG